MMTILAIILLVLVYFVGRERGLITIVSLMFNFIILAVSIFLMSKGFEPVVVTFICCMIVCSISLFFQNGKNAKTLAAFSSVLLVLVILFGISYFVGYEAHLRGINEIIQYEDEVFRLRTDIGISMSQIAVSMILIGLIGAAVDASIAISTAVYEVYQNDKTLNLWDLFYSGMRIGKDILGGMTNTLYFVYLGESLSLFILFKTYDYSFLEMMNSKAFCQDIASIVISCISCILVIPVTAMLISYILKHLEQFERWIPDDDLFYEE